MICFSFYKFKYNLFSLAKPQPCFLMPVRFLNIRCDEGDEEKT